MNHITLPVLSVCLGAIIVAACATNIDKKGSSGIPESWISQFEGENGRCRDIAKTYINEGEIYDPSSHGNPDVYLSDLMFTRLEGGLMPDAVEVVTDATDGHLIVFLNGPTQRVLEYPVSCQSGWFLLEKRRTGEYLGEGVKESSFVQRSFFRKGTGSELIVRIQASAKFNSLYVFNSESSTENWYRFQPISAK